jgi:hypothetical protein
MMSSVVLEALFWGAAAACAAGQVVILRAVLRTAPDGGAPAASAPAPEAPDVPKPNRPLEILWAVLPGVLLAAAFAGTWRAMHGA